MRLLFGILRLVALVFMVVVSSSLDQAVVVRVGAIRLHDRRAHGEQWAEERMQLRAYLTMDYNDKKLNKRHIPKHN
ncbi:uncharacterized protein LOC124671809 [Lolium rigidum]|uniref:uncharacterized protein LOC124671809 n=1 Tax=Lolium rigidum TaxID=89674 RepID=UPI001F5C875C|nr:uncharacterized protein LOC124671809 [Lolium rigidum]